MTAPEEPRADFAMGERLSEILGVRVPPHYDGDVRFPFALSLSLLGVAACAETPERPRTEDDARQLAPLPACITQLQSDAKRAGAARSLREEQLWPLVYPTYDAKSGKLPEGAHACNGRVPELTGGHATKIEEGNVVLGGGGDRLKVAWLRSHTYDDGTTGGALALVRSLDGTAEVYAVGSYRAHEKVQLSIERIGPEIVVAAIDDTCTGRKQGAACETQVTVFAPRSGVLAKVASIATERVSYAADNEPGLRCRAEYRLTSAITYADGGIKVLEQVLVRDEQGREIRKAELERAYTFAPDGSMVVDEDSLWAKVVNKPGPPPPKNEKAKAKSDGG